MTWDESQSSNSDITSSEWNTMVTHVKSVIGSESQIIINASGTRYGMKIFGSGTVPCLQISAAVSGAHLNFTGSPSINPIEGDFWRSGVGLYYRTNGSTYSVGLTAV